MVALQAVEKVVLGGAALALDVLRGKMFAVGEDAFGRGVSLVAIHQILFYFWLLFRWAMLMKGGPFIMERLPAHFMTG